MKKITNPEKVISENAKATYNYNGPKTNLTDEQKASFIPYTVETVEDVLMLIANSLKEKDHETLIEIHDRLMVSDIELAYDTLIVMLKLGDDNKMYSAFVPATEDSKIDSKGIYRRCLGALPIYSSWNPYNNPVLGIETYPTFAEDIIGNAGDRDFEKANAYRDYVSSKYAGVIKAILAVRIS